MCTEIKNYTEEPSKTEFYPTPEDMVEKMLSYINLGKIHTILEPSAGTGNILREIAKSKSSDYKDNFNVDCLEIDNNLRQILKYNFSKERENDISSKIEQLTPTRSWDRNIHDYVYEEISESQKIELEALRCESRHFFKNGIHIVGDDFLAFHTNKKYDLIIMNPPFSNGEKHLLKAIEMQEKGGQIVCLLNAQTLLNPFSNERKALVNKLEQYDASIEYINGAFSNAERSTDVDIALVYISIPDKTNYYSDILDNLKKAQQYSEKEYEATDLTINDYIKSTVQRYNLDVSLGIKLIEEYKALEPYFKGSFDDNNYYEKPLLLLDIPESESDLSINKFLRGVRMKYWNALLRNENIMSKFTTELREHYINLVYKLADFDISEFNIKTLICEMNTQIYQGVENAIVGLFDKFTKEYSYYPECSKTIHYFNGWKTNKVHKIGKKVIIPFHTYDKYSWNSTGTFYISKIANMLKDVEKVFDYFDGCDDIHTNIYFVLDKNINMGIAKKIELKYFYVTIYKKGTVHIEFKDQKLVDRFNIYACQHKNWLPPTYGKIHYEEMTQDEKAVIDSFQGKENYEKVLSEKEYYLSPVVPENALMLASGL